MASIQKKQTSSEQQSRENYSVDEMMGHLKKGERQKRQQNQPPEGELITREDGSQVIKVRRRKRRSKQPPKKTASQTNPKLKWAVLGTAAGLLVALVVGTIFIIAKYNGRKFKATTESTITDLTGAEQTSVTQFRVTPVSAQAIKTDITWGKYTFLKNASFSNIRAHIKATSFFTTDWIGEEVVATKGKIHLQTPTSNVENSSLPTSSPYRFGSYRCNQLDLIFGSERTAPAINDLQVSLRKLENEQYQIIFQNGILNVKNWPKMNLSSGIVTLRSQSAEIEALLKDNISNNGELTIKGSVPTSTADTVSLSIKAKSFPIEELLGQGLGRMIKGEIQGDSGIISYDYKKETNQALSFILPFQSTDIRCEGFPMFKALNKLLRDTAYARPIFTRAQGTIIRTSEGLNLNDLELISNGFMLIQGNIAVNTQGKLSGTLSIGIPQSAFDDDAPEPFSGPRDGFYHLNVELSGSVQTPNDNLHELLKASRPSSKQRQLILPKDFIQPRTHQNQPSTEPKEADFNELTR